AARSMHVEHESAEPHRLAGGALHGVRDVVELEIEEDLASALAHGLHGGRPGRGEELRADLEAARRAVEGVHERDGAVEGIDVEGDDETIFSRARHSSPGAIARSSLP